MTYREEVGKNYPYKIDPECMGGVEGCPYHYNYETYDERPCKNVGLCESVCRDCWDREIPDGECIDGICTPREEQIFAVNEGGFCIEEDDNEKEKTMAKKTKAELEKELETIKESKAELEKEIKNLEKYKQYDDMAGEVHAIYMSFVMAGFSEEQAFDLLKTMIKNAGNINFNTYAKPSYRYAR